jgi:hypothetical protein
MKSPGYWRLLALGLLWPFFSFASDGYTFSAPSEGHRYRLVKDLLLVEARLNGELGYFLFDTGASHLTLNRQRAKGRRTLRGGFSDSVHGIGEGGVALLAVDHFQWGRLERRKFQAPLADLSALERGLGVELLGLIGHDVIKNVEVDIDPEAGLLYLRALDRKGRPRETPARPSPTHRIAFDMKGHLPVLSISAYNKFCFFLALDSGASAVVLDESWREPLTPHALAAGTTKVAGADGGLAPAQRLIFEGLTVENSVVISEWAAVFLDLRHLRRGKPSLDGLLGGAFLSSRRIAINYRQKVLLIWESLPEGAPDSTPKMSTAS